MKDLDEKIQLELAKALIEHSQGIKPMYSYMYELTEKHGIETIWSLLVELSRDINTAEMYFLEKMTITRKDL